MACANRGTADVITGETLQELEERGGKAILTAITSCPLEAGTAAAAAQASEEGGGKPSKRARKK